MPTDRARSMADAAQQITRTLLQMNSPATGDPLATSGRRIFVSYARADHAVVERFVNGLESERHSVWWDRKLKDEEFRDEIKRQLDAADAAVVFWTPASVGSDFVRWEADRAIKAKKLVQVKVDHLDLDDIPAPFSEKNVMRIHDIDGVSQAVRKLPIRHERNS